MNNETLELALQKLDFSEKERAVYLAAVELGTAASSIIARKSGLPRTTGYSILQKLFEKGYVKQYRKANIQYFTAIIGNELLHHHKRRCLELQKKTELVQSILPMLDTLQTAQAVPPKVQYYEGFSGVQQMYEDTLKNKDLVLKLAYSSAPHSNTKLMKYIERYVQKRTAQGMHVRVIFPDTPKAREFAKNDKKTLRISRFAPPKEFKLKNEINIYGNKVAIMSIVPPHYHGVIIESSEIAETQKAIFELAWRGAKN